MQQLKCVAVGDDRAGTKDLLRTYVTNHCRNVNANIQMLTSKFNNYSINVMVDGSPITLSLFDTSGQGDDERPKTYPETDVVLICFSVGDSNGIENIQNRWIPELEANCPRTRYVLVGTKIDGNRESFASQAVAVAETVGAEKYVECSSSTEQGLQNVFDEAIRAAMMKKKPEESSGGCSIM